MLKINTSKSRGELKLLKHLCKKNGWKEVFDEGSLMWSGLAVPVQDISFATKLKVNRIPQMTNLCHKETFGYMLNKFAQYWPEDFDYVTPTYNLPAEAQKVEALLHKKKGNFFIAKPTNGSQGDGIVLITSLKDIPTISSKEYIVQPYIDRPLLLANKKFDLRLYVLVARVDPFIVLLNETGIARVCAEQYRRPNKDNFRNPYIHLTNYHLNKDHKGFQHSKQLQDHGNKQVLHVVWQQLIEKGVDVDALKQQIIFVLKGHFMALYPFIKYYYKSTFPKKPGKCFHLLGVDVLIDEAGTPHILQFNANPSLKIQHEVYDVTTGKTINEDSPVDFYAKEKVVEDAILFVDQKKAVQIQCEPGSKFRTYQVLLNGPAQMERYRMMETLVRIFHFLTGARTKFTLNSSQFCKLGRWEGMTGDRLQRGDYHLLFIKIMRSRENPNMMDFQAFLAACEVLAERLFMGGRLVESMLRLVEILERPIEE